MAVVRTTGTFGACGCCSLDCVCCVEGGLEELGVFLEWDVVGAGLGDTSYCADCPQLESTIRMYYVGNCEWRSDLVDTECAALLGDPAPDFYWLRVWRPPLATDWKLTYGNGVDGSSLSAETSLSVFTQRWCREDEDDDEPFTKAAPSGPCADGANTLTFTPVAGTWRSCEGFET